VSGDIDDKAHTTHLSLLTPHESYALADPVSQAPAASHSAACL